MRGQADTHAADRERIQREVDEFLARGGKIEMVEAGKTNGKAPISKAGVIDGWVDWNRWAERL